MADFCFMPYSLIPLSSAEALWEWDIVTDAFFLTKGALKSLNLAKHPRSMPQFYSLLPREAAMELATIREGIITGKTGSMAECGYICNGFWVDEHAIVLTRNSEGRATRLMGQLRIMSVNRNAGFRGGKELLAEAGLWQLDAQSNLVWRDRVCEEILGIETQTYPVPAGEFIFDVHPAEREAIARHYELFIKSELLGDTITDIVRIRTTGGKYLPSLVRATAMQRDEQGRALKLCGLLAPGEPEKRSAHSLISDDRLMDALNSMGSGQWNWDPNQDAVYFCPRYLSMLGYAPEEDATFAHSWRDYVHPDDLAKVDLARQLAVESPDNGDTYECTYRMRQADGGWAWIFDRGCVTWRDAEGRAGHLVGSLTNITTAQAERDRLEDLVRHDSLTGLRSRAFCNLEIEQIEQNGIRPVSAISVDITGLKMVNDYLGHAKGDELLTQAATLMREAVRRSDCIGRTGGDEFVIILPGCDFRKGKKVLAKLESAFEEHNRETHLPVFAAMGLASAETVSTTLAETIALADEEMYRTKRKQREKAHAVLKALIRDATGRDVGADERL